MLALLPDHVTALLAHLDDDACIAEVRTLLANDPGIAEHLGDQETPYDASFSEWRTALVEWADERLAQVERERPSPHAETEVPWGLVGDWLRCEDAFVIGPSERIAREPWIGEQAGRVGLVGFRFGDHAVWLPGTKDARWQARRWLAEDEPLLRLPYQRKYDHERHGRVDARLRDAAMRVSVADDLVECFFERLHEQRLGPEFSWPEVADIRDELQALGLDFGLDDLSSLTGGVRFEVIAVDRTGERPRVETTLAAGAYAGALGGYHRLRSGMLRRPLYARTLHYMLRRSLTATRRQLAAWTEGFDVVEPDIEGDA